MSQADILEGGCLCGRIRYRIEGVPAHVGHCHCESCRKATGTAFATFAWVAAERLTWLAEEPRSYRSSAMARRGFCPACGTAISFQYDEERDKGWDIHVGSLDDPSAVTPKSHVWYPGHVKWLALGDELPRYDKNSPQSEVQI